MSDRLTDVEIQDALKKAPGWELRASDMTKTFQLSSFPAALIFAAAVGHLAEAANHHPDILIQYKKVTLTLSTHDANGLTVKDFGLARQIDALPVKA